MSEMLPKSSGDVHGSRVKNLLDKLSQRKETFHISEPFAVSLEGKNHENEDALYIGNAPLFVIADGVSRSKLPDGTYETPSGAMLAARTFVYEAGLELEHQYGHLHIDALKKAINQGNRAIRSLNTQHGITPQTVDFFRKDYFSVCAAIGVIKRNTLYYATIGDAQIAIFNKHDQLTRITENQTMTLETWREGRQFASKEERLMYWRQHLRNHPNAPYQTYGTLTGEQEALAYVNYGMVTLHTGDFVTGFSDGLAQFVMIDTFRDAIRQYPSEPDIRALIESMIEKRQVVTNTHDDKTIAAFTVT